MTRNPRKEPKRLTKKQQAFVQGQVHGRSIWQTVLLQLQQHRRASARAPKIPEDYRDFRFLDLPAEIRNTIYELCIACDNEDHAVNCYCHMADNSRRGRKAKKKLTRKQKEARALVGRLENEVYGQHERMEISDHTRIAFADRVWQNRQTWCYPTEATHDRLTVVHIHPSGGLCRKLPAISCVNGQAFEESWGLFFPSTARFQAALLAKDIFPSLRLFATLERHKIKVTGRQVTFVTYEQFEGSKDIGRIIKKLIMMHWFNDFPLWHCITGIKANDHLRASKPFGK